MRFVVGITGSSGVIYGVRFLERCPGEKFLIVSEWGRRVLEHELGLKVDDLRRHVKRVYRDDDLSAPFASGSNRYDALVLLPCSLSTLGKVASGIADTLVTRTPRPGSAQEGRAVIDVDGLTKLSTLTFRSAAEEQAENYRKMMVAMASDVRVILIKLADRLHNMRTLEALAKQKQIEKARETLEIYAPLAHRLGIHAIKWELEDLAFAALHPRKYTEIKGLVNQQREERESYVQKAGDYLAELTMRTAAAVLAVALFTACAPKEEAPPPPPAGPGQVSPSPATTRASLKSIATLRRTSSRCAKLTSGPMATPSWRGSPTTTSASAFSERSVHGWPTLMRMQLR